MNKKIQSTIWLDLLTYIILPLIVLGNAWNILHVIFHMKWTLYATIMLIIEIALIIFYSITVYHSHKRTSLAPKLFRAIFWVTSFQASFSFANTEHINKGYNLFLMFGIYFVACYIVWIRTNETYFEKRMGIFGKESTLKKNYRCPKCKRLVPNGKDCPHCKEDLTPEKDTKKKEIVSEKKKVVEKEKSEKGKEEKKTSKEKNVDKKLTKKED